MRRPSPDLAPQRARAAWDSMPSSTGLQPELAVRCKLITPMYGGGVTPGKVDCELPIRASALRGQLRFWWRLLHGADRKSEEIFDAEAALWGGISNRGSQASRVAVRVKAVSVHDRDRRLAAWRGNPSFPFYALILEREDHPELLAAGYGFDLELRFQHTVTRDQRAEVNEALRWWASFGGVGARTRRGLGAVQVTSDDFELKPVQADEVKQRGGWMVLGRPTGGGAAGAVGAWKVAVDALARFRQGAGFGRKPG